MDVVVNGWRFDPTREVWWIRTGENTWSEVKGDLDHPPPSLAYRMDDFEWRILEAE